MKLMKELSTSNWSVNDWNWFPKHMPCGIVHKMGRAQRIFFFCAFCFWNGCDFKKTIKWNWLRDGFAPFIRLCVFHSVVCQVRDEHKLWILLTFFAMMIASKQWTEYKDRFLRVCENSQFIFYCLTFCFLVSSCIFFFHHHQTVPFLLGWLRF